MKIGLLAKTAVALSIGVAVTAFGASARAQSYFRQRSNGNECVVVSGSVTVASDGKITNPSSTVDAVVSCPLHAASRSIIDLTWDGTNYYDATELSFLDVWTNGQPSGVSCRVVMTWAGGYTFFPASSSSGGSQQLTSLGGAAFPVSYADFLALNLDCTLKKSTPSGTWPLRNSILSYAAAYTSTWDNPF